jgi:hypothetical protein
MPETTRLTPDPALETAPLGTVRRPEEALTTGVDPTIDDPPENPGPSVGGDPKPGGIRP